MPSSSLFQSIIYLIVIKTLICHTEIEVDTVYSPRICTKYDTCFSKYSVELMLTLSSTNATKRELQNSSLKVEGLVL